MSTGSAGSVGSVRQAYAGRPSENEGNRIVDLRSPPRLPKRSLGYPFGAQFDFGIEIAELVVTVYPGIVYRGGIPITTTETPVTLSSTYLWLAVQVTPGTTPGSDTAAIVRYDYAGIPQDHGVYMVRALHLFEYVDASTPYVNWVRSRMVSDLGMFGH